MSKYKETSPTNDLYIYLYKIASKLKNEGVNKQNYTKKLACSKVDNVVSPTFCKKMINKYSNVIIKEL